MQSLRHRIKPPGPRIERYFLVLRVLLMKLQEKARRMESLGNNQCMESRWEMAAAQGISVDIGYFSRMCSTHTKDGTENIPYTIIHLYCVNHNLSVKDFVIH